MTYGLSAPPPPPPPRAPWGLGHAWLPPLTVRLRYMAYRYCTVQ